MPQQKYPLRNNPRQTYEGDEWETAQSKKGRKNMRKQQKNGSSYVNKEKAISPEMYPNLSFPVKDVK